MKGKQAKIISQYIEKHKDSDFIALQEATNWKTIRKLLPKKLKHIHNNSGPEEIITFYDSTKYTLNRSEFSEFRKGRPIQILYFDEGIVFVNLHMPNPTRGQPDIHQNLPVLGELLTSFDAPKGTRYILAGDFNGDLNRNKKHKIGPALVNLTKQKLMTCCEPIIHKHVDHVMDTKGVPKYVDQGDELPYGEASDHKPVIALLSN